MSEPVRGTPNQATSEPPGNAPPFYGQRNSHQQHPRPGTPPDMYNWFYEQMRTSPTPPGSVHYYSSLNPEPSSKCSFCAALGCELYTCKKVVHEYSFMMLKKNLENAELVSKNIELEKRLEEVALSEARIVAQQKEIEEFKEKNTVLQNRCVILEEKVAFSQARIVAQQEEIEEVQKENPVLQKRCVFLEEKVALSEAKILALQKEIEEFKEKNTNFQKRCVYLEYKCCDLDQQCSLLTKEKEQLLNAQDKILQSYRNSSLVSNTNTDSLDSSENEESSSKTFNSAKKHGESRYSNHTESDVGQTDGLPGGQAETKSTQYSRARSNPSTSRGDGAWNNQQIYPNRNTGPRSNPQRSSAGRFQDGSWPTENRPNQGSADHSKENFRNADGSNAKPRSEFTNIVQEVKKDLFDMPEEYALAHCVGSDFIMSSGVAVNFRKKFRHVPELLDQNKNPGQVAFLDYGGRFIYYLVTKLASTGKPSWDDFERAVIEWSRLCVEHNVTKIAIPKIGCGRDQLDWNRVRNLLNEQFSNHGIEITVCMIDQEAVAPPKWNLTLKHTKDPLSFLDPRECALVFIASKDRIINASTNRLATKYGFTTDYGSSQLGLGSIYQYTNKATKVNIFGLVVKEKQSDPISFSHLGTCLQALRRAVKKLKLYYMGFEAFDDPKFQFVTRKLWTAVIDTFFVEEIEVYFCWPEDVKEKNWEERALQ